MICLKLFITFFKIGIFTFGGGYAMLPLIQAEVLKNGWLSADELINFIAVSESTPGPFAINIATYIGTTLCGIPGAASATLGVVLPSFIIILTVAHFFEKFKNSSFVKGVMSGLKPAVIGLIAAALISVAKTVFFSGDFKPFQTEFYVLAVIFAASALLAFKKVHPILIILLAAASGILAGLILGL